jgi:predicted nuclease of predicted toxin-antitoxin system
MSGVRRGSRAETGCCNGVKLLLDENLSGELVEALADLYPGSEQVLLLGLGGAGDGVVWEDAKLHGLTIVSKDSDFYERSMRIGAPPRVIWIRLGNCSTGDVARLLRSRCEAVRQFFEDDRESCLVLRRE